MEELATKDVGMMGTPDDGALLRDSTVYDRMESFEIV
jgi:hypothetical protein